MIQLNFHQTFPPTLLYVGRLMELAARCGDRPMNKEEISAETGIPTGKNAGKVVPHIHYGILMGALAELPDENKGGYVLRLTTLGKLLFREDSALREQVSQLLCHVRMTSPATGAPLWTAMMREILPKYLSGIEECVLEDELKKKFSAGVKVGPVYSTYQSSFDAFSILEVQGVGKRRKTRLLSLPFQKDLKYVYAYCLLYEWEQLFSTRNEISAEEMKALRFGQTFGWNAQREFEILEQLNEIGVVGLNRQLYPFTVVRKMNSEEVGNKLFSLLL